MEPSRNALGLDFLARVEGHRRAGIVTALSGVAPDLARLAIEFAYGELYPRPHLDLCQRQLVTVSALSALGGLEPQLRFHAAGALNVGCTPRQLVELMIHLVIYAGFPAALNGTAVLRQVFEERGVQPETSVSSPAGGSGSSYDAGLDALKSIDGEVGERVIASLKDIAPDLGRFIVDFAFGQIYTRAGLDLQQRELVTVAALAAMGSASPQFKVHAQGFLNVGGTQEQLIEVAIHLCAYAGFPRAINAALAIQEVLSERGDDPAS
ncbi:carboxymuconolactone decarboxylase family protein [Roseateles sp. NT4]|uniref:carboxymuconolactone decarboxylase family protein n=1 Tax=Roseateles sp. NT4 TaxID=3453715 RepID=UPI003EEE067B